MSRFTEIEEYFTDPYRPTFITFGKKINYVLERKFGLGILDLPDRDYSSMHEEWDGTDEHIIDMVQEIIEDEGY